MARPALPITEDLVSRMPKAELHLHLDGSLRPSTALELARRRGLATRRTDEAALRRRLSAPRRGLDQAALLRAFDLPVRLLQDAEALARAAGELVDDVAVDRTRYAEIRWAPALHTAAGLTLDGVIGAVADGVGTAARAAGVVVRLIVVGMRSHEPSRNVAVAEAASRWRHAGVVGFDLAGPEEAYPDPTVQRRAFEAARTGGLHLTVHAGEWGGPAQVWSALRIRPERIAHGAVAAADPFLVAELAARGITLDLCPTSNVQAGLYPSVAAHPLAALLRAGVPVTLSTDDRTVSSLTLVDEYRRAARLCGLTAAELWRVDRHGLDAAFADDADLVPLRRDFDRWAADEPLLAGRQSLEDLA